MERNRHLTPSDLSDNPALGILAVLEESLHLARLALSGVHGEILLDEPLVASDQAAAQAYAFALLFQMRALEDTIRSYALSVAVLRYPKAREDHEDDGDDVPPF